MNDLDQGTPQRGRLRRRDWVRVTHGTYKSARHGDGLAENLLAWQLVLPTGGGFSHLTAAQAYGWWLPPLPADLPVFVAVPHAGTAPRRAGLLVSRHPVPVPTQHRDGLVLTTPEETLLACGRDLGVLDLTVLADAALHLGHTAPDRLAAAAARRRRGAPALRRALRYVDGRSESAWETLLRMLHTVCDVPVEPQYQIHDETGGFVARGDLRLSGTTTLHEYDGGEHLTRARQRHDLDRERRLGRAGWTRRGYTAAEVLHQPVAILRDADHSLGRPHRPARVRTWYELLRESLFTPTGRARARRRWAQEERTGREPA